MASKTPDIWENHITCSHYYSKDTLSSYCPSLVLSGLVGLALSYALSVTNLLSGLISSFTQTETMMVSVERTEEYTTDIPMEPQEHLVQVTACTLLSEFGL